MESLDDLEARIAQYPEVLKVKIRDEWKKLSHLEPKVWYCKREGQRRAGNLDTEPCDGDPHPGAPYQHARSDQWPPLGVDWETWLMLSGRGGGKTRSGAEWLRSIVKVVGRIAIVAMDNRALRETVIEGESGLIYACENAGLTGYLWEPSKKKFTFPNGAYALGFSGEEPDSLRGPQFGAGWVDEGCHMPAIDDVWSNLMLGMRLPGLPGGAKTLCTTTPLPVEWLVGDGDGGEVEGVLNEDGTRMVRVSSRANLKNLDKKFAKTLLKLDGTRKGRQEIEGEILMDVPGALWKSEYLRYVEADFDWADLEKIVVGVDPAGSAGKKSDETGIIVVGLEGDNAYVLEDRTGKYSPRDWAKLAVSMYEKYEANLIVAEKNYGGDMVLANIRHVDKNVPVRVRTASRSKELRAEPVVTLYEDGRVFHVRKRLQRLEDEMLRWVPGVGKSPNRVDACFAAGTHILTKSGEVGIEVVGPGDEVWTRGGWRPVEATRLTRRGAQVVSVALSNGRSLVGTPDHKILMADRWVRLDSLVCGDILSGWNLPPESSSTESSTPETLTTHNEQTGSTTRRHAASNRAISTGPYTRSITGPYLAGGMFTMPTSTPSIMNPTIWWPSPQPSMRESTRQSLRTLAERGSIPSDPSQVNGIVQTKVENGIEPMLNGYGSGSEKIRVGSPASNVGQNGSPHFLEQPSTVPADVTGGRKIGSTPTTRRLTAPSAGNSSGATSTARSPLPAPVYVVRVSVLNEPADVYDIQVADLHEFVAEGVIVHNCVWAVSELIKPAKAARIGRPRRRAA